MLLRAFGYDRAATASAAQATTYYSLSVSHEDLSLTFPLETLHLFDTLMTVGKERIVL
jgi:hypothetical protein